MPNLKWHVAHYYRKHVVQHKKIIAQKFAYIKKKQYLCIVKEKGIKIMLYIILGIIAGFMIVKFIMYIIYCYKLVTCAI